MSGGYQQAIRHNILNARSALTHSTWPVSASGRSTRSAATNGNARDRSRPTTGKWIKGTRWSLLKSPEKQTIDQFAKLGEAQAASSRSTEHSCSKWGLRSSWG